MYLGIKDVIVGIQTEPIMRVFWIPTTDRTDDYFISSTVFAVFVAAELLSWHMLL